MNIAVVLVVLAAALLLATALAFLPMRVLLEHMAANIRQFVVRQAVRRADMRETPERRKETERPPL